MAVCDGRMHGVACSAVALSAKACAFSWPRRRGSVDAAAWVASAGTFNGGWVGWMCGFACVVYTSSGLQGLQGREGRRKLERIRLGWGRECRGAKGKR
jgi:hypothetical protein